MKIAGLITVYNGLELLPACVENLRNQVDEIVICWQDISNKGEFNPMVERFVRNLKGVHLTYFEPTLPGNTKKNERDKHNLMLRKASELNCSHFVLLATDHFYTDSDFEYVKKAVQKNDYDVTFTDMFTYYKHPEWRLDPIEDYCMPFICKIYPHTVVKEVKNYPIKVDPSVQVNTFKNWFKFHIDDAVLHHYSKVRDDIEDKYRNAAASVNWNDDKVSSFLKEYKEAKLGDSISYYGGRELIKVNDIFNLRKELKH